MNTLVRQHGLQSGLAFLGCLLLSVSSLIGQDLLRETPSLDTVSSTRAFSEAVVNHQFPNAWSALTNLRVRLDSGSTSEFGFEFVRTSFDDQNAIDSFMRILAGCHDGAPYLVFLDDSQLPSVLGVQGEVLNLAPDGSWLVHKTPWQFSLNATDARAFTLLPKEAKSKTSLDLSSYFSDVDDQATLKWIASELAMEAADERGTLRVVLNTPSDQLTHGQLIAELRSFSAKNVSALQVRGITQVPQLTARLKLDQANLPPGLRIIPATGQPLSNVPINTPKLSKSAQSFWGHIGPHAPIDKSRLSLDAQTFDNLELRERLHLIIGFLLEDKELTQLPNTIINCVDITNDVLQVTRDEKTGYPLPDAPVLRWRHTETQLGELYAAMFSRGMSYTAANPKTPYEAATLFTRLQIMLGQPPWHDPKSWQLLKDRPDLDKTRVRTFHAFRNACWGYGADEHVVESCKSILEQFEPRSAPSHLAIDVLVRLGIFDAIPKESLDAWFASGVIRAEDGFRSYHLAALTMTSSGRAYLLDWVKTTPVRTEAWNDSVRILTKRADNTLTTERFDFMQETECIMIRESLQTLMER